MVIPWVVVVVVLGGTYSHTCFMGYYTGECTHLLLRSLRLHVVVIVVDCCQSFCKSFSAPYLSLPCGKYMVGSTDYQSDVGWVDATLMVVKVMHYALHSAAVLGSTGLSGTSPHPPTLISVDEFNKPFSRG